MGIVYTIYAEIKFKDKWYNLNPIRKSIKDGAYKIEPIVSGKSFLHEAFEKLEERCSYHYLPDDLSDELYDLFKPNKEMNDDFYTCFKTNKEYYDQCTFVVNFTRELELMMANKPKHEYKGYVKKSIIKQFNNYEIEEIYDFLDLEKYLNLSDKQKLKYSYFEWDNYFDYYPVIQDIIQKVVLLRELFIDGLFDLDYQEREGTTRDECRNSVRLICYADW